MAVSSTPRARKPRTAQAFTRKLLAWYRRAARDLPWRRTRDPYRVLVSEFMLQQTQVSRVAEFYPRFLERFPDLGTPAPAPGARGVGWAGILCTCFQSPRARARGQARPRGHVARQS